MYVDNAEIILLIDLKCRSNLKITALTSGLRVYYAPLRNVKRYNVTSLSVSQNNDSDAICIVWLFVCCKKVFFKPSEVIVDYQSLFDNISREVLSVGCSMTVI